MISPKKIKKLFILWVCSYVIVGFFSNLYVMYQLAVKGYNPITLHSGYQFFALAVLIFYFIPLISLIFHYSRLAALKKYMIWSGFILIFLSIGTFILFVLTVLKFLFPNL